MAHPLTVEDVLTQRAAVVEPALRGYLRHVSDGALADAAAHVVHAGGKRLRPTLALLACEAVGAPAARAVPVACGVELLHTFTLVHDDLMDGALVRRHRPTVEARWGAPKAVLTGDWLFSVAFGAFADAARAPGVGAAVASEVVADAAHTCLRLAEGQALDVSLGASRGVTVDEALRVVRLKTGALLAFALRAGARVGGAEPDAVSLLSRVGSRVGEAFQLRDDLLDLVGSAREAGKPVGGDVRAGKRTPLVAHALQALPAGEARRLAALLDAPPQETGDEAVAEAVGLLGAAGALDFARERAARLHGEAVGALDAASRKVGAAGNAPAFAELRAVVDFAAGPRA